ncbi:CLUMA_CG009651, isoform A [Clunio marinus]|uniref:CLUMA_CG009651, isoform A n=1 Tax=Clunio marinus TaxID=568069 RepID=A0A1J1I7I8_9DIPT|nr:CLUMA_CG009651, isoform A [Clunio marinus]
MNITLLILPVLKANEHSGKNEEYFSNNELEENQNIPIYRKSTKVQKLPQKGRRTENHETVNQPEVQQPVVKRARIKVTKNHCD